MKDLEKTLLLATQWLSNDMRREDETPEHPSWECSGKWIPVWSIEAFYPYTHCVHENRDEVSLTNLHLDAHNWGKGVQKLAEAIARIWFQIELDKLARQYNCYALRWDNKSALKLKHSGTGEVVYMGWYDGSLTISKNEPVHCYGSAEVINIKDLENEK